MAGRAREGARSQPQRPGGPTATKEKLMIWTSAWWKATGERMVSTAAQFALGAWGGGTLPDVSLPWWTIPVAALAGAALTLLKCLAATGLGRYSGPSLNDSEKLV
jgi:hypothetical protein